MGSTSIRLFGTATDSIVDGVGLRFAIFVQGCPHGCPGCHNPESHSFEGGYETTVDALIDEIDANKLICGVTLSGGEPLAQSGACLEVAERLKQQGFNLWLYSGYLFEDVMAGAVGEQARELVSLCDVMVDGPFVNTLQSYELVWKGSSNQRVIDVPKSLKAGKAVLWEAYDSYPEPPASW